MYINEIKEGTSITISVDDKLSFETEVTGVSSDSTFRYILCKPIFYNKQLLSFTNVNASVTFVNEEKKQFVTFNKLRIVYNSKLGVYIINSDMPGKVQNRRGAYRVPLTNPGYVRASTIEHECYIRDISETGVGILTRFRIDEIKVGQIITISFDNNITAKHYNIRCRVVSIRELAEDRYVYGCVLEEIRNDVIALVNEVQRHNLACRRR